ncbi:hypothetical protein CsSME_00050924 [Camellia sinensis var. sinensis]
MEVLQWSGFYCKYSLEAPRITWTKKHGSEALSKSMNMISWKPLSSESPRFKLMAPFLGGNYMPKKGGLQVVSPNIASPGLTVEHLDAWDDEYDGAIIDPENLPLSTNAFASALRASMSNWKSKGKKGIWLKILQEQAELAPIAIQEGFNYHHAEPGYVMLTYWIPEEPCTLPASPSHQIGIAGFVINDKRESEDIFSGATREVKEETGVDTTFLEIVAFRHAHLVAFEKSDLMFVCMLKPLSFDITIDEKEIEAAKWMPVDEVLRQPFYIEDHMSKKIIELCLATHEHHHSGFIAHQLASKFDGNLSYLYYNETNII